MLFARPPGLAYLYGSFEKGEIERKEKQRREKIKVPNEMCSKESFKELGCRLKLYKILTTNSDEKVNRTLSFLPFKGTADRDLVATKAKRMTAAENAAQSTKNRTEILIQSTLTQLVSRFSDQCCQL